MGAIYKKYSPRKVLPCFRAIEISGSHKIDLKRNVAFSQFLLLHNDIETLEYVERNMVKFASNSILIKKAGVQHASAQIEYLPEEIKPLLESTVLNPKKNRLHHLTVSLKRAILSLAIIRFNADKETICKVLGLSESQLDDEMCLTGLCLLTFKDSP